jgi:hypothetical protein
MHGLLPFPRWPMAHPTPTIPLAFSPLYFNAFPSPRPSPFGLHALLASVASTPLASLHFLHQVSSLLYILPGIFSSLFPAGMWLCPIQLSFPTRVCALPPPRPIFLPFSYLGLLRTHPPLIPTGFTSSAALYSGSTAAMGMSSAGCKVPTRILIGTGPPSSRNLTPSVMPLPLPAFPALIIPAHFVPVPRASPSRPPTLLTILPALSAIVTDSPRILWPIRPTSMKRSARRRNSPITSSCRVSFGASFRVSFYPSSASPIATGIPRLAFASIPPPPSVPLTLVMSTASSPPRRRRGPESFHLLRYRLHALSHLDLESPHQLSSRRHPPNHG